MNHDRTAMPTILAPDVRLSFCIATFNRADYIGATLESIISQAPAECEIVISDNASTDNTEQVVAGYAGRFSRLRYVKQAVNGDLDKNFDCAVGLARGEYCWLMSDDDTIKPGAVSRLLRALSSDVSLVIVNMEIRDQSLSKIVADRWIGVTSDHVYASGEIERLFVELSYTLMNICNIIIKRTVWIERERDRFYGTMFIHVGVIFQAALPGKALVIAQPLINYRGGNAQTWSSRWGEVILVLWPSLVESLPLSEHARRKVRRAAWEKLTWLLLARYRQGYSIREYRRHIRPRVTSVRERVFPICVAILPPFLVSCVLLIIITSARIYRSLPRANLRKMDSSPGQL